MLLKYMAIIILEEGNPPRRPCPYAGLRQRGRPWLLLFVQVKDNGLVPVPLVDHRVAGHGQLI